MNIVAVGRIGILGAGLAVGAALASLPGIAAADPTPDPNIFSSIDPSLLQDAFPALASTPNLAISIDGFNLLESGTASATSGMGDIAIASGNDSTATATGGVFDLATANSVLSTTGGTATAGDGNFDVAQEGGLGGVATADNGSFDSAFALTGNSGTALAQFGNGDFATNIGDGLASAGGTSPGLLGNVDIADNFGSLMTAMAGSSDTASGSYDLAAILAGGTPDAIATGENFLVTILPSLF